MLASFNGGFFKGSGSFEGSFQKRLEGLFKGSFKGAYLEDDLPFFVDSCIRCSA